MLHHILESGLSLLSHFWPLILAVLTLGPMLALVVLGIYLKRKIASHTPDQLSERELATAALASLRRLPKDSYQIISSVLVPRLDGRGTTCLHHLVLSRFGFFVIHIQDELGQISGEKKDSKWSAKTGNAVESFVNPLIRNRYHVKALSRFLGLPEALFHSIIYFPNVVSFETEPPANILTARLGRHIISHKAEIISPEVIARALQALTPAPDPHEEARNTQPVVTSARPASAPLQEKHVPLRQR